MHEDNNNKEEPLIKTETTARIKGNSNKQPNLKEVTSSQKLTDKEKDVQKNKEVAALSYIWLLSILIFHFRKDSKFIQRHSKQSVYLFVFSLIAWFLSTIPYIYWVGLILLFVYVYTTINGFFKAITGQEYNIPFLSDLIVKQNINNISNKQEGKEILEVISKKEEAEQKTFNQISNQVHNVLEETNKDE